jgi:hypothetical protein
MELKVLKSCSARNATKQSTVLYRLQTRLIISVHNFMSDEVFTRKTFTERLSVNCSK